MMSTAPLMNKMDEFERMLHSHQSDVLKAYNISFPKLMLSYEFIGGSAGKGTSFHLVEYTVLETDENGNVLYSAQSHNLSLALNALSTAKADYIRTNS